MLRTGVQRLVGVADGRRIQQQPDDCMSRVDGVHVGTCSFDLQEAETDEPRRVKSRRGGSKHVLDGTSAAGRREERTGKQRPMFCAARAHTARRWCQSSRSLSCGLGWPTGARQIDAHMYGLDCSSASGVRSMNCWSSVPFVTRSRRLPTPMHPLLCNDLADLDASFAHIERIGYAVEAAATAGPCGGRIGRQCAFVVRGQSDEAGQSDPNSW